MKHMLHCTAALGALMLALGSASAQSGGAPAEDERTTLGGGLFEAESASWNMALEHNVRPIDAFFDERALFSPQQFMAAMVAARTARENGEEAPPPPPFTPLAMANTDFAFQGNHVIMGNYHGFLIYDIESGSPELVSAVVCPGGQGDVSVHGDLLFLSVEHNRARLDCGSESAEGDVNPDRFRGIRIFDISDITAPRQIAAVQTCRGSHTHTLVPDPNDSGILYVYNSGTQPVRSGEELEFCSDGQPGENPETSLYSIDIIRVPLDAPETAELISSPRIFADRETGEIAGLWQGGQMGIASQRTAQTNHCHDITVYPELNLAGGACSGNGILLDITDPANPARISDIFDPDMAYWHSATFNNEGDVVVFTDEWGGGVAARCRAEDPANWGANLIATIEDNTLRGQRFYKLPSVQGASENCVAHNGSLIPVPGRDIMVQAWYQGGISVMDFTDPQAPFEIAYFDRGPVDADDLFVAGYWSAYWYNGRIYGSEIARGLDVLRLTAGEHLSEAELAAAEAVMETEVNPQTQTRIVWEDSAVVAQAYLDQLARGEAVEERLMERASSEVARWADGRMNRGNLRRLSRDLAAAVEGVEGRDAARIAALSALFGRAAG
ncbi:MAG: LVIVD repeat-containing protein [Caulobacterales bacterium]|uniref:LVIVD repeat-containing protein n=1 Tax=Glycocaulis sp. TaxID=1969725 RepID=UPI003FA14FB9